MTANVDPQANGRDQAEADQLAGRVKESLDEGMARARETFDTLSEDTGAEMRRLTGAARSFVRDNPGTALVGAVGVGVLLGLALRSRL